MIRDMGNMKELAWITYNELMIFCFGLVATVFMTNIAKYSIGRLRPHFIDACRPRNLDAHCPINANNWDYIESYECMSSNTSRLKDARLSFWSGHSSMSAYSMIFTVVSVTLSRRSLHPTAALVFLHESPCLPTSVSR